MQLKTGSIICPLLAAFLWRPFFTASAQPLAITHGIQKYRALTNTTVTLTGRCEWWAANARAPRTGCPINLTSIDAWRCLPNVLPARAAATDPLTITGTSGRLTPDAAVTLRVTNPPFTALLDPVNPAVFGGLIYQ